jgi:hypothetical protein
MWVKLHLTVYYMPSLMERKELHVDGSLTNRCQLGTTRAESAPVQSGYENLDPAVASRCRGSVTPSRLTEASSEINDGFREPVKNVLNLRHHRQRQFNNLAEPFPALSYLSESVDCDGKT